MAVAAVQHLIDAIHSFTGLNWSGFRGLRNLCPLPCLQNFVSGVHHVPCVLFALQVDFHCSLHSAATLWDVHNCDACQETPICKILSISTNVPPFGFTLLCMLEHLSILSAISK